MGAPPVLQKWLQPVPGDEKDEEKEEEEKLQQPGLFQPAPQDLKESIESLQKILGFSALDLPLLELFPGHERGTPGFPNPPHLQN